MAVSYFNPVYGGPLVPTGMNNYFIIEAQKDKNFNSQPVKYNNLQNQIMNNPNYGFYSLFNIKAGHKIYYDIHILLTTKPEEKKFKVL